jgi:hypothetical protein
MSDNINFPLAKKLLDISLTSSSSIEKKEYVILTAGWLAAYRWSEGFFLWQEASSSLILPSLGRLQMSHATAF